MAYYRSSYSKYNKPKSKPAFSQQGKRSYQSPQKAGYTPPESQPAKTYSPNNAAQQGRPAPKRPPNPPPPAPAPARPKPKPKLPDIVVSKEKDQLIRSLQVRWWYVIPDWPDPDTEYAVPLATQSLKLATDKDLGCEAGVVKVKRVGGFPGLFQDQRGTIYDLRDKSTCPTYRSLAEKTETELEMLLLAALQNQVAQLTAQSGYDVGLAQKLEERIAAIINKDACVEEEKMEEDPGELGEMETEAADM